MYDTLAKRLERLRAALDKEHLPGLILNQQAYIYHLTNWIPPSWANVFLLIGPREMVLVTPFVPDNTLSAWSDPILYESFALDYEIAATDNAVAALQQALSQTGLINGPLGAVLNALPAAYGLPLSEQVKLRDVKGLMHEVTSVKDEAAQQAIRQRVSYLDRAFEVARDAIRPGVTETEVFGKIFTSLAQSLGGPLTLDCNFGSGPRALGDEPQPTNKPLEAGESVMIDLFPLMDGYVADYTRNFVVGPPTDGQLAQHAILETALAAAEKALRPGVRASEIDRLVRRVIQDAGYGEFAHRHHTGHAFGLTIPEPPWLIPADHTPLRAGMVIAVEPGIYHPENGGMRLEGNYIITEDGCEPLVGFPAKLIVCK